MVSRRGRLIAAVSGVTFAVLAGCSAGGPAQVVTVTAPASSTAAASPTATPSPTPTLLTKEQAAARYLKLVKPSNAAFSAFHKEAVKTNPSLSRLRKLSAAAADQSVVFVREMQATPWPKDVQPLADRVASDAAALITPLRQLSRAKTWSAVNDVDIPKQTDSAAQLLRAKLGLPEVPAV